MTTDWYSLNKSFCLSPYYYTDKMKTCFVYDNPYGYSINELMLVLNASANEIVKRYDIGLEKYKFIVGKGGRLLK